MLLPLFLGLSLLLLFLRSRLLFLLEALLLQLGQQGAGDGQVVARILVAGVRLQHRLIGLGGPRIVRELETGVAQVVAGILLDRLPLHMAEALGCLLVATGAVQGHAPAVGVGEALRGAAVVPGAKGLVRLLLLVGEPAGLAPPPGEGEQDQGREEASGPHEDLPAPSRRKAGRSKAATASTGR